MAQVVNALGAFVVNLLASSTLLPDGRGTHALILQICYLTSVIALLGVDRAYIVASDRKPFPQTVRDFSFIAWRGPGLIALLGIIAVAVLIFAAPAFSVLPLVLVAYAAQDVMVQSIRVGYITSGEVRPFLLNTFLTQGIILALCWWLMGTNVTNPVVWVLAAVASGVAPLSSICASIVKSRRTPLLSVKDQHRVRSEGLRILPGTLGGKALLRADRLLLPVLGSLTELGLYTTVATVMEMISWPVQQWVDLSLRSWRQKGRDIRHGLVRIFIRVTVFSVGGAFIAGIIVMYILLYVLPEAYIGAAVVIIPLGVATVLFSWTRVLQGVLIALGAPGRSSGAEVVSTVASVVAFTVLIPTMGMLGAALGSIIGYLFGISFAAFYLRTVLRQ